jgi:hypothetical protein
MRDEDVARREGGTMGEREFLRRLRELWNIFKEALRKLEGTGSF